MQVGFTGTREGMQEAQMKTFIKIICDSWPITCFRHGCCVGADEEAVFIVDVLNRTVIKEPSVQSCTIFGHPSNLKAMTSEKAMSLCEDTAYPEDPLDRNHDIVDGSDLLIACPKGMAEEQRSGTWATIRWARLKKKKVIIIWPDGTITVETP